MADERFFSPKEHMQAEFMQIFMEARLNGLWATITKEEKGNKPKIDSEDARGNSDCGGLFLPGNLLQKNADDERIYMSEDDYEANFHALSITDFRKKITLGLKSDGATLVFPYKVLAEQTIPNSYLAEALHQMNITRVREVDDQFNPGKNAPFAKNDLLLSYVPPYFDNFSGTKNKVATPLAYWQSTLDTFYLHEAKKFDHQNKAADNLAERLKSTLQPIHSDKGELLFNPGIICTHATRYAERNISGLTRILNPSPKPKYGQFQTITFEYLSQVLQSELQVKPKDEHIVGIYKDKPIYAVLRDFGQAEPRMRPKSSEAHLFSTEQFNFDVSEVEETAKAQYKFYKK